MRRAIVVAAVLAVTFMAQSAAEAAERCPRCGQVHGSSGMMMPSAGGANMFQQLWQLEQRKNAWLRRTFLR
ncbi:MAG: hypothetical protein KDA96_02595 [Planctomycetaceae bacterium]|nr:hypothetical protein [Planctomycetaceae bacterium]